MRKKGEDKESPDYARGLREEKKGKAD
jgi:hypothetical protein